MILRLILRKSMSCSRCSLAQSIAERGGMDVICRHHLVAEYSSNSVIFFITDGLFNIYMYTYIYYNIICYDSGFYSLYYYQQTKFIY